jgi:malonyl-CoA O-methyltransferase
MHSEFIRNINDLLLQREPLLTKEANSILLFGVDNSEILSTVERHYPKAAIQVINDINNSVSQLNLYDSHSVDIIYCPMLLTEKTVLYSVFQAFHRVLKQDGILLFATLAPDTFTEIKKIFAAVLPEFTFIPYSDMHHWGDLLQQLQFKDPVVEVENFTLYYPTVENLLSALNKEQLLSIGDDIISSSWVQQLTTHYECYRDEYGLPVSAEVVYGIAFGATIKSTSSQEVSIPLDKLRRKS